MVRTRRVKYSEVIFKLRKHNSHLEVNKNGIKMKFGQMSHVVTKMMVNNKIIED